MIKELEEETELNDIIKMVKDKDIILIEGYKKSDLRKIEVFRKGVSERVITPKSKLIAIASDTNLNIDDIIIVDKENYKELANLIEKEKDFNFENYQ